MALEFDIFLFIGKPVAVTYEAVADPKQLTAYFTTAGAVGRIETGASVTWEFADFPGPFEVKIREAIPNEKIVFEWDSNEKENGEPLRTQVTFTFEPVDDGRRTKVMVHESGWSETAQGRKASYGNCMGWVQMLAAMKAWLEYGINLREGAYR